MDWTAEWFDFEDTTYLNAAWQGPLPRVSERAVQMAIEWKKYPYRIPDWANFELPDQVRSLLARLMHCDPTEIAVTTGASSGMGIVALCLDWNAEDEVLVGRGDFVAHAATWTPLADAGRLRLKTIAPRGRFITAEDFVAQIGPRTRLVSTSLVRPYDGILLDAAKLSEACREVGAFLLLDVSQCVGVMPLDLSTLGADFVVSSGYKWLLGPYGTGFFWVRTEALSHMRAAPVYWKMLEGAHDMQRFSTERIKAKPGACRWDSAETSSFFNLAPLACSLELLLKVEVRTIWEHNRRLVSRLVERLPSEHCVLTSPTDPNIIGPYACFAARAHEKTKALYEKLRAERIFISLRDGALRVAPHLYNAEADIDRLLLSVHASRDMIA